MGAQDLDSELSIILGAVPASFEAATEYINRLALANPNAEVLAWSVGQLEDATAWRSAPNVRLYSKNCLRLDFIEGRELSTAERVNQLVAAAGSTDVLVLEYPFHFSDPCLADKEDLRLSSDRDLRVIDTQCVPRESDDGQSGFYFGLDRGAFPFVVKRRYFLEARGFDETKQYGLAADFYRRHLTIGDGESVSNTCTAVLANWKPHLTPEQPSGPQRLFPNLYSWSVAEELRFPLVTVAIATKDRANLLLESLRSVLYQTFQDFEIVVVDDGSEDVAAVENSILQADDPRIKLTRHEASKGVAAARNRATDICTTLVTAIHDDDDLMLPTRLMDGVLGFTDEITATYGGWINFDEDTGDLKPFIGKHGFGAAMVAHSGAGPGHSTWTLLTRYLQKYPYDERLTSSVDHELATRLANAGVIWKHTGDIMYLRRVHDLQITAQDTNNQKAGHTLSKRRNRFVLDKAARRRLAEQGAALKYARSLEGVNFFAEYGGYLPDNLVRRKVMFTGDTVNKALKASLPSRTGAIVTERSLLDDKPIIEQGYLEDVSQEDLVKLRRSGLVNFEVVAGATAGDRESSVDPLQSSADQLLTSRLRISAGAVRRKFPNCKLLICVEWGRTVTDEYLGLAVEPLDYRRVVVAEQEGYRSGGLVIAFENWRDALEAYEMILARDDCGIPYFCGEKSMHELSSAVDEFATAKMIAALEGE